MQQAGKASVQPASLRNPLVPTSLALGLQTQALVVPRFCFCFLKFIIFTENTKPEFQQYSKISLDSFVEKVKLKLELVFDGHMAMPTY